MSYCRFSNDDYQCDVYCYESVGDFFAVHVAGMRYKFKEPLPPPEPFTPENIDAWMARHTKVMEMVDQAGREDIGLSRDGQTFGCADAEECADLLQSLKDEGYNVPQCAIDALREEAKEGE